ncbi:MAG: tRNA (guanine(10)-N(2))-dimethyltransferase [archaeon]
MQKKLHEGKAVFFASVSDIVNAGMGVFYNPVMRFSRDISVLLLDAIHTSGSRGLRVGLPLAGSGVRGLRFLKELPASYVKKVSFNDGNQTATKAIQRSIRENRVASRSNVVNMDANSFLLDSKGFDYIDIDPFGSPMHFLDAAMARISRGGILALTATDTSALCGSYPKAGMRKYGARPLKGPMMHELAVRILISTALRAGAVHEKGCSPLIAYSTDHYVRVVLRCEKGRKIADDALQRIGFLAYCPSCLRRESRRLPNLPEKCICGKAYDYAGPLYLGPFGDCDTLSRMIKSSTRLFPSDERLHSLLIQLADEAEVQDVGHFNLHDFARKGILPSIPRTADMISMLKKKHPKSHSCISHTSGVGIRTDAGYDAVAESALDIFGLSHARRR